MVQKFIVDTWTAGNAMDDHEYIIASSEKFAREIAFKFMRHSYKELGVDYSITEFEEADNGSSWIDEEGNEFGVNIYPAVTKLRWWYL